jgi:hypothetical protein
MALKNRCGDRARTITSPSDVSRRSCVLDRRNVSKRDRRVCRGPGKPYPGSKRRMFQYDACVGRSPPARGGSSFEAFSPRSLRPTPARAPQARVEIAALFGVFPGVVNGVGANGGHVPHPRALGSA